MLGADTKKVGIIKYRHIKQNKAEETLIVKGYTLSGITKQRKSIPPLGLAYDRLNTNAETIMKAYMNNNCINPADPKRSFLMLVNSPDVQRGDISPWQTRYKTLDEELEGISRVSSLGWHIYLDFDLMKWVFDVYEGKDLTADQDINPPVIFSVDFDNIEAQEYIDSVMGYSNVGYVAGQGEGADRTILEVGDEEGLNRYETFIDARDIASTEENPLTQEEVNARLIARGNQKLTELDKLETFECEILTNGPFIYEKDWNLGDIVTTQNKKWGVTMNTRITEVTETYEANGLSLRAIFGNQIPTLIDKIKRELAEMTNEVKK